MSQVAIQRCKDYNPQNAQKAVYDAVALLGGIERFVKPGQKVLLKPNMLSARPPESGVCTHPEVVRAAIRLIKGVTSDIYIGDSSGGFDVVDIGEVYETSGIAEVCRQEKVSLVKFDSVVRIDGIPFAKITKEVDVIINIPKMKTHSLTVLTGAVKNMFGTTVGKYKAECHFKYGRVEDFCRHLVEIFSYVKPRLTIMDGIVAMDKDGPAAGRLRNAGLVLAGPDAVAVDAVFAELAGVGPDEVFTTIYAGRAGLGTAGISDIQILGERLEDVKLDNFILPTPSFIHNIPEGALKIIGNLIKPYPFIGKAACVSCRICEKSCPAAAINIDRHSVDYSKCIFCFCCHELCPYNAIGIHKTFFSRIFSIALKMRSICSSLLSGGKKAQSGS